ncbi:Hypothetical protein A7982_09401 [Minicystis rosea]|nr:Hypothetical protein A7982_09401 [Minicystis rosea]
MRASPLLFATLALVACEPDVGAPTSLVTSARILAVRADPPEAKPGVEVSYRALVASPTGTVEDPSIDWAFCASPKPLTENNAVSTACLADGTRPIGGPSGAIAAPTPLDACALFGPDPPPGDFRPRDPDVTGGFYQPVRARLGSFTAFALERVTCNLPNAPIAVAIDLEKRYRQNDNPTLVPLTASIFGAPTALDRIPAGAAVTLETGWLDGDAEPYVMFDPGSVTIVECRESLRVSWFTTAGVIADDTTGRAATDLGTTTQTLFQAPSTPGPVHLWMVLRDSRGGVDFAAYTLTVVP